MLLTRRRKGLHTLTIRFSLDPSPLTTLLFAYLRNDTQPKEAKNEKAVRAINPGCPYCSQTGLAIGPPSMLPNIKENSVDTHLPALRKEE
jgi:hypothetical protein